MTEKLTISKQQLAEALANSGLASEGLEESLAHSDTQIDGASLTPADTLLDIYQKRLALWREMNLPRLHQLDNMVSTLESRPFQHMAIVDVQAADRFFAVLCTPSLERVLSILEIDHPRLQKCISGESGQIPTFSNVTHRGEVPAGYTGWVYVLPAAYQPGDSVPTNDIRSAYELQDGQFTANTIYNPEFLP